MEKMLELANSSISYCISSLESLNNINQYVNCFIFDYIVCNLLAVQRVTVLTIGSIPNLILNSTECALPYTLRWCLELFQQVCLILIDHWLFWSLLVQNAGKKERTKYTKFLFLFHSPF